MIGASKNHGCLNTRAALKGRYMVISEKFTYVPRWV